MGTTNRGKANKQPKRTRGIQTNLPVGRPGFEAPDNSTGRFSDLRLIKSLGCLPVKSHSGLFAESLVAYSSGPVPDLHRLPFSSTS